MNLPSELRNRVYKYALLVPYTVDLDSSNPKRVATRLDLLRTSRKIYEEAYPIFYGLHTFRIFPTLDGFLNTKMPLLMRLPRHYRRIITSLELRLGPGWSKPPKCQTLRPKLGLKDCKAVRSLKIFVEVDPSHEIFEGFRVDDTFYTAFSSGLLNGILHQIPSISVIEFDAYPSVKKRGELMSALIDAAQAAHKRITWGPSRDWEREGHEVACDLDLRALGEAMATTII